LAQKLSGIHRLLRQKAASNNKIYSKKLKLIKKHNGIFGLGLFLAAPYILFLCFQTMQLSAVL